MVTESGGLGRGEVGLGERVDKGTLKAMNMLIILIVVMVSWVYSSVKTHQIVHFKYMQSIVCQLCLNKA